MRCLGCLGGGVSNTVESRLPPVLSKSALVGEPPPSSFQLSRVIMYLMIRFMASSTFSPVLAAIKQGYNITRDNVSL